MFQKGLLCFMLLFDYYLFLFLQKQEILVTNLCLFQIMGSSMQAFDKIVWEVFLALLMLGGGTALVVLLYMWMAWYASMHNNRLRGNTNVNPEGSRKDGLSRSDIQKLPTFICSSHPHEVEEDEQDLDSKAAEDLEDKSKRRMRNKSKESGIGEVYIAEDCECTVCLEQFKDGEKCLLMPTCKHCFHVHCADAWLSKSPICPLCRTSAQPIESKRHENEIGNGSTSIDVPESIVVDMPT